MFDRYRRSVEYTCISHIKPGQVIIVGPYGYRVQQVIEWIEERRYMLVIRDPVSKKLLEVHNLYGYQSVFVLKGT